MSQKPMQELEPGLSPEKIEKNLNRLQPVYTETRNGIDVFIFTGDEFPELIKEVGRLRELTFRSVDSGSGKAYDIDSYDTEYPCYRQIIVYDRNRKEIIAGCRCFCPIFAPQEYHHRPEVMASSSIFSMSEAFIESYLPYTLDVGRTIIIPELQALTLKASNNRSPLEYIWKGFGYLLAHFDIRYFFGRVVIYEKVDSEIKNLLYHYLKTHFAAFDLVSPTTPVYSPDHLISHPFSKEKSYSQDLKELVALAKEKGEVISPLIRAYVQLSPTMKFFGSALDSDLGDVEEMAIMITIKDIHSKKFDRFRFKG